MLYNEHLTYASRLKTALYQDQLVTYSNNPRGETVERHIQ